MSISKKFKFIGSFEFFMYVIIFSLLVQYGYMIRDINKNIEEAKIIANKAFEVQAMQQRAFNELYELYKDTNIRINITEDKCSGLVVPNDKK